MNKDDFFYREFIIGLGFLSGLWITIGMNPEALFIETLKETVGTINPNANFSYLSFIPALATTISIIGAYWMGGIIGLFAVSCAFLAGLLILSSPITTLILLVLGIIMGEWAVNNNSNNSNG